MLLPCLLLPCLIGVTSLQQEPRVFSNESDTLTVRVTEKHLGYPEPSKEGEDLFSPDGMSLAYVRSVGGEFSVVHDGQPGPGFKGIAKESLRFSPNSQHLVYVAVRDKQSFVVFDGAEHPYPGVHESGVVFSADGTRYAWVARNREGQDFAVIEGEPRPPYEEIGPQGVLFSPDGGHHAYVATLGGLQAVVRDDVEGPFLDKVLHVWWGPTGQLAFVAVQGEKQFVFVDDQLVAEVDGIGLDGLVFATEAPTWALAVRRGEIWSLLLDGQPTGEFKRILSVQLSDDGRHHAFVGARGSGLNVVLDGVERDDYETIPFLRFAPHGVHTALIGIREGRQHVEVDGEVEHVFDAIEEPGVVFSESGQHYFYIGTDDGRSSIVLDGKAGPPFSRVGAYPPQFVHERLVYTLRRRNTEVLLIDGTRPGQEELFDKVRNVVLSRDGSHFAFWGARGDDWTLVVDGEERATQGTRPVDPALSFDGTRLAWVDTDETDRVVVDGVPGRAFDLVGPGTLSFSPDGKHYAYCAAIADHRFIVVDDVYVDGDYSGFRVDRELEWIDSDRLLARASRGGDWVLVELTLEGGR